MKTDPNRMKGRAKVCPRCWGEGVVPAPRQQTVLAGFIGSVRLPCPRCKMLGWVEETEIDCEATDGW
jgi:ribosomal protein S27AE